MKKLILSAILASSTLFAHQVTAELDKDGSYWAKFWAHGKYESFKVKQLKGATSFDENNQEIKTAIDYSKGPKLFVAKKPAMVALSFDTGYWVQTEDGYKNLDPSTYKGLVFNTLKSIKYGKRYFTWSENFTKPIGLAFELVPLINPMDIKVGEKLPVLVIKDGKALANAGFETSDYEDLDIKTNEYGIAHVPVKSSGLQIIAAIYFADEINDPNVNKITIQSSISFEVK